MWHPLPNCEKSVKDSSGTFVTVPTKPSWICYTVVILGVLDALHSIKSAMQADAPNLPKTGATVLLDAVSCYIMLDHCNACQAWRGFWMTLGLEVVGKTAISMVL